jgi:hypothetical protein
MLVARTKAYFSLFSLLPIAGGIALLSIIVVKADYQEIRANLPVWILGVLLLIVFLFVLPIRSMENWQEIHVDREKLIFIKQPSKDVTSYDLKQLNSWQLQESFGRYDSGTWHLRLSFVFDGVTKKVVVSESVFDGFDELTNYFKKYYRAKVLK